MADTGDLKSPGGDSVRVRIPLPAPSKLKEVIHMTKDQKKKVLEVRLNNVKARGKHLENPGVVQKIERQIRNLSK